jgi:DNA helicase-2/ATP-dependent DNA helicase PcrA
MTHTPTPQQTAIYEAAIDPKGGNLAISALAGTGKTTTAAQLAARLPGSGLATSVMRSTTADLARVMPSNWSTIGMHALGYRAIKKKLPQCKLDKSGTILYNFCKEALADEKDGWWKTFADIKPLVEQAQLAGIVPGHDRFATEDTEDNWFAIADRFDLEWSPLIYSTAHAALQHLNREALKGNITFTHMLTLPLFWSFPVDQSPKIIVDEAQDLNILQHLMIQRALRHNGRVFITGDPNQAIMAFAGSDSDSFHNLVDRFNCRVLPLTWCWRCGSEIIDVARQYVPDLEAPPGAHTGAVTQVDYCDLGDLPRQIIVRNNAPGTTLAMRLFAAGYSVEVAGRDIGAGLKSAIKRVASGKNAPNMRSSDLMARLRAWADREIERRPARQPAVRDKLGAIGALATQHSTISSILKHLDNLYVNEQDGKRRPAEFQISTIHKAKGREWDRVGFLDPHLIPAKWAKKDWERQAERNLAYVATTRAKNELVYLNSELIQ